MQMSIFYKKKDQYLLDRLEKEAQKKRMSKSALVLSILEEYLEAGRKLGQILKDMRAIDTEQLHQALSYQRQADKEKRIGKIMLEEGYVREVDLDRALNVQRKQSNRGTEPR